MKSRQPSREDKERLKAVGGSRSLTGDPSMDYALLRLAGVLWEIAKERCSKEVEAAQAQKNCKAGSAVKVTP